MDLGLLEQKLRTLPGVLDCSVSAEGVAVVVHPEVDPRLIELQAQVLLAEAGDRRPLLVVGGMTVGPRVLPPSRPPGTPRAKRTGPSPVSLVAFAVLVLGLLAVVPIASRGGGTDRVASPGERSAPSRSTPGGLGRVTVEDEPDEVVVVAAGPPAAAAPAVPGELAVVEAGAVEAGTASFASAAVPTAVPVPAPSAGGAASPVADPTSPPASSSATATGDRPGKGKGKGDRGRGPGGRRSGEVRAAGHGDGVATAMAPPGKGDPPGRRRGQSR